MNPSSPSGRATTEYRIFDQPMGKPGSSYRVYKTRTGACRRIRELHRRDNDCYEWRVVRGGNVFYVFRGKNMGEHTPGFQSTIWPNAICYHKWVHFRTPTEAAE